MCFAASIKKNLEGIHRKQIAMFLYPDKSIVSANQSACYINQLGVRKTVSESCSGNVNITNQSEGARANLILTCMEPDRSDQSFLQFRAEF